MDSKKSVKEDGAADVVAGAEVEVDAAGAEVEAEGLEVVVVVDLAVEGERGQ